MARVTVEDCVGKVEDRFELVAIAAQRAKNISAGEALTIERNEEKDTVLSLREIAQESVSVEELRESIVKSYQREREIEEDIEGSESEEATSEAAKELQELETEPTEPEMEIEAEMLAEQAAAKEDADKDFSFEEDNLEVDD